MWVFFIDRIGIWNDGFCRGSKTGELGEKHSEQDKNQQQSPIESQVGGECSHHSYLFVYTYSLTIICKTSRQNFDYAP